MKKNDIIELEIEGIDFPAKPYGRYNEDGKKYYANINVVPGQKIKARIGKIKNNKVELRDIEIIEQDQNVEIPFCDKFNKCGGCSFQYLKYEEQVKLKSDFVIKLVDNHIKNKNYIKNTPIFMSDNKEYKNKMEFSFGNEVKNGPLVLGLHKKNSFHDIVMVNNCKIMDENFRNILKYTNDFFREKKIGFYHRISHEGFLRNLVIRKGEKSKQLSVNLITSSQLNDFDIVREWESGLHNLDLSYKLESIIHTINDNVADTVRADKEIILHGNRDINENIFDLNFKISPYSFFQTNSKGVELLYNEVIKRLEKITVLMNEKPVVFDLFSGTGTIGQIVAKYSKFVYGIELIEEAVIKANENASLNNIQNAKFISGDVFDKLNEIDINPDVIILDPPRSGVGFKTIEKLIKYETKNIIYVSCNPKTLAEDLRDFEEFGYILKDLTCVDMFCHSPHIETVVLLTKI